MEARLIHAHKVHTIDSEMREWRIINPLKLGIRVDESQVPSEYTGFFNANIRPDVSHFLTEIAGQGGLWGRLDAVCGWEYDVHFRGEGCDAVFSDGVCEKGEDGGGERW